MTGERLKKLRLLKHMTQGDVAKRLFISRSAYSMYETGKRQIPYKDLLFLADYYKVSTDYLLGRTDVSEIPRVLSPAEKYILERFYTIDARGKETLFVLLNYEFAQSKKKKS